MFPCPLSRATDLGDVKLGLAAILQTAKLAEFREKVRVMQEDRLAKLRMASELPKAADDPCLPEDCIPTDCIPIDCIPTDCIPTDCIPTDCIPTNCIPTNCIPTDCIPTG